MKFQMNKIAAALVVTTVSTTGAVKVFAQEQGRVMLEEVVVTAQKRAQSVQDVPIAISAYNDAYVKDFGITNVGDLAVHAPGLNGSAYSSTEAVFTLRGIGTAAFGIGVDSSVGVFIDDIALGRPAIAGSSFFDIETVEVVKGPQGTLFGRNTSAGAISVTTKRPSTEENSVDVLLAYGDIGQQKVEIGANLAVSDSFALRVAVRDEERDGSLKSTTTGRQLNNVDDTNLRVSALVNWTDSLRMIASAETGEANGGFGVNYVDSAVADFFGGFPLYSGKTGSELLTDNGYEYDRATLKFSWDISDSMTLVSNTGYYKNDYMYALDFDASADPTLWLEEPQNMKQWSQEFRLNGSTENIDWFVGVSGFSEEMDAATLYKYSESLLLPLFGVSCADLTVCLDPAIENNLSETENTSYAVYGDIAWSISEALRLTVGGRYSKDEKDFSYYSDSAGGGYFELTGDNFLKPVTTGKLSADDTWTSFDPRIVLDYQLNDDIMLYASYATGFKSGGFNSGPDVNVPDLAPGQQQALLGFDEEKNEAFEVGMKGMFWDGRARLNVAAFYSDYTDLQIENPTGSGISFAIENAADATSQGIELDGQILVTDNFEISGNYSYLDATFDDGQAGGEDISGNKLSRAPKNAGALSGTYTFGLGDSGDVILRATAAYTDEQFFDANNTLSQESYTVVGGRLGWTSADQKWGVAVVGENLGDEEYVYVKYVGLDVVGVPALGRYYRVELNMNF